MQSNPAVQNACNHEEGHYEKWCEIQGGNQEMAVIVGKNFTNDNSGEFGAKS